MKDINKFYNRLEQMNIRERNAVVSVFNSERTEKGTTVGSSIGDKRMIGSVGKRSEAEGDKVPETVTPCMVSWLPDKSHIVNKLVKI